jgi:hypothetical protein
VDVICFSCKNKTTVVEKVPFRAECDCGEDLHVCKNCEFYDPKVYNECREPTADVVKEKERANYCEFYRPRSSQDKSADRQALLSAAEALFKKSGGNN